MRNELPAGALALAGSGEYTPAMLTTDSALLATLGTAEVGRVAVLPTASALEPGQPERWSQMGLVHFQNLGIPVERVLLLTRTDALDPAIVTTLEQCSFYSFSGGNPDYLVETLSDTPAWSMILHRHQRGAALFGCSASAMMLGGSILSLRRMRATGTPEWRPALGLLPGLAIFPHFDRMRQSFGQSLFDGIRASAPADLTMIGIDEDTALLGRST